MSKTRLTDAASRICEAEAHGEDAPVDTSLRDIEIVRRLLQLRRDEHAARRCASSLLTVCGGLGGLARTSALELVRSAGISPVAAERLVAAVELGRRVATRPLTRGSPIRSPVDVDALFGPSMRDLEVEEFRVIALDARHRPSSTRRVSSGTLTASLVHPREVFRWAVREAAAAIIVAHNHPSGDPQPSGEDAAVTERLAAAGRLVGIRLIDHVIVAAGGHFSFRESGCLDEAGTGATGVAAR